MTSTPTYRSIDHDSVKPRPKVAKPTEYGNAAAFWIEYPSGLVDLTRSAHLPSAAKAQSVPEEPDQVLVHEDSAPAPPLNAEKQWEVEVEGDRSLRMSRAHTAIVIIDMQKLVYLGYSKPRWFAHAVYLAFSCTPT